MKWPIDCDSPTTLDRALGIAMEYLERNAPGPWGDGGANPRGVRVCPPADYAAFPRRACNRLLLHQLVPQKENPRRGEVEYFAYWILSPEWPSINTNVGLLLFLPRRGPLEQRDCSIVL